MEQKKTLWIIAAVGLFLLVVLGAAMFLYPPSARTAPAVATINPVERKTDTLRIPASEQNQSVSEGFEQLPSSGDFGSGNISSNDELPAETKEQNTLRVSDLFVVSENTTVYDVSKSESQATTIDLNALRSEVQPQPPVSNINITVNLPEQDAKTVVVDTSKGETKSDANASETPAVTKVDTKNDKKGSKADSKTDSKKKNDKTSSSLSAVASADKGAGKSNDKVTETASKAVTRFWVQVAAYSNKKSAENARSVLDNNKIPADIFTYEDNKSRLFYRVRVGPYTTKSEAEYWKAKIEKISDFAKAESYITSTVIN